MIYNIPQIEKREFGFLFPLCSIGDGKDENQKPVMVRHLSFTSNEAVRKFIDKRKPLDCFYSTAYYNNPSARKMNDKGWLGADLFYDLDGKVEEQPMVKAEATIIQYILKSKGEGGFALKSIEIFFSGAKGYHVISSDEIIRTMDHDARVDMVDYLAGKYKCKYIDGPASTDIHRFRRMPETINSKSGKLCKKVVKIR